jgi:hypothetical protein
MKARTRKLIGSMGIVGFLGFYVGAVAMLAERLPPDRWVQLVYFVVAGVGWGLPIIPLIWWMNRGD